ncbi:MAG: glycosyltransferase family 2 protein [Candidatus Omnitrophica bacterium]|nr:glycosyltransferase family 2 protein [Candidatus Omnitrophota bacterium]
MKTLIIIPTFNESRSIVKLLLKIKESGLEVLVIDDGSSDKTAEKAKEQGVIVIKNDTNQGKGATLKIGFTYALENGYQAVITMDGDGQHSPDELPRLIQAGENSSSGIIVGNRMQAVKNMPLIRILTNKFMSWFISRKTGQYIADTQCGLRLIKREVLEKISLETKRFEIESELLIKASLAGFKIESLPITSIYYDEKSQINPFTDTLRFIKFILHSGN